MNFSFDKIDLAKKAVSFIVGAGTGQIVRSIIKNNIDEPERVIDKITMTAAAWTLGGMVADATKSYTDAKVDEIVDSYKKIKNYIYGVVEEIETEEIEST